MLEQDGEQVAPHLLDGMIGGELHVHGVLLPAEPLEQPQQDAQVGATQRSVHQKTQQGSAG